MAKTGTKEWSTDSMNIQKGCENGCLYCYARYDAVVRWKNCEARHWSIPCINEKKVDHPHKNKYRGVVMFPTIHDITSANISQYMTVLKKLLDAGNKVLIVTKPRWDCIPLICESFLDLKYRDLLEFRFTIGSTNNYILSFWEPNASHFEERLACLQYAHEKGYKTSVSCEPMLDAYVAYTYDMCKPFITQSFWIGMLRNWESRVQKPKSFPSKLEENCYKNTKAAQSDNVIKAVHAALDGKPFIKWKDSIRKVIGI